MGYIVTSRGMGRLRGRRLGQYDSSYSGIVDGDPSLANPGPNSSIFDLPGGINWQNLSTGTLSPSQVAALQANGAAGIQDVYNNAVANYGVDSPAADAVAGVLQAQQSGVYSDIAAINPQPSSTDPLFNATGISWYWWALIGVGAFALMEWHK